MKGNGFRTLRHDLYSQSVVDFLYVCVFVCVQVRVHAYIGLKREQLGLNKMPIFIIIPQTGLGD